MINRISTTHIKEGQPGGKYYENQKEEQAPVCGEPDFSYPKGRTVPLIPQLQECRQTGFVLSPPHATLLLQPSGLAQSGICRTRAVPGAACTTLRLHRAGWVQGRKALN